MIAEVELGEDRREHGQYDQTDLDPLERKPQEEDQHHHEGEDLPFRVDAELGEQAEHQLVAAERAEHIRKPGGTEKDHEHHAVGTRRIMDGVSQHLGIQALVLPRKRDGTEDTDPGALGRRGPAGEYRAQHDHHDEGHREEPVNEHVPELSPVLGAPVVGQARRLLGAQERDRDDVQKIKAGEEEARHRGRGEQATDRRAQHFAHHDHHDAWRNEDAERSRGCDRPDGEPLVIALAEHLRERDQCQQDHGRPHYPDRRREDSAHDHDGDRQTAGDPAQQELRRFEHVFRRPASFEKRPHEDKHRQRYEDGVGRHAPPHAQDDVAQSGDRKRIEGPGDESKDETRTS